MSQSRETGSDESEGSWGLPPLRSGYAASDDLIARRARAAGSAAPDNVAELALGGVRCLVIEPTRTDRTILYLHGGGYRMGRPEAWVAYATRIAQAASARVAVPDYRLAPENPFPAGLRDAVAVFRALEGDGPVVVAGDSAGGGLAAALCVVAHRAGRPPSGAILVSPMLDLEASGDSYARNAQRDTLFSRTAVRDCALLYLQGHPIRDPLVSPLHADAATFPPTLILVGGAEVLLDEGLDFARRLAVADRRVTLHMAPGMGHVWPMMAPDSAEAATAVSAMALFVEEVVRSDKSQVTSG